MITASQDYLSLLYQVQNPNRQTEIVPISKFKLSEEEFKLGTYYVEKEGRFIKATTYDAEAWYYSEPIYYIDLNTRKIEAPEFLSVEYDHNAETIYFQVDRFFDNVDLATVFCVIEYQNADKNKAKGGYIYPVPYFDIQTLSEHNRMIIQWRIEGPATAYSGNVDFDIKFYKLSEEIIDGVDGSQTSRKIYDYVLNTLPATSKVLHGMDVQATSENYYIQPSEIEMIYQRIEEVRRTNDLYWIVLSDDINIPQTEPDYPESTIDKNDTITDLITG